MSLIPGASGIAASFPDGFLVGDGSVTAPSFRFQDTQTGFYRPGMNQWALSNNGVQSFLVSATGLVTFNSGLSISGGSAANNSLWVASNVLRQRGGTSGWAVDNTSGNAILSATNAGAWTLSLIHNLGAGNILSGQATGTISNSTNTTSLTSDGTMWTRVGDIVTVTFRATFSVTSANTESLIQVSLPIASNLTTTADLFGSGAVYLAAGSAGTSNNSPVSIFANIGSDRANCFFRTSSTGSGHIITGSFQYVVK
jgi:hypothetical protein